ncbi:hypothetical protein, partial [Agrobacterium sp.]|uniref:hypothetical protein n=1 Tax=Agrobacterium sp. TaxID=361 RepID=UPI004034CDFC
FFSFFQTASAKGCFMDQLPVPPAIMEVVKAFVAGPLNTYEEMCARMYSWCSPPFVENLVVMFSLFSTREWFDESLVLAMLSGLAKCSSVCHVYCDALFCYLLVCCTYISLVFVAMLHVVLCRCAQLQGERGGWAGTEVLSSSLQASLHAFGALFEAVSL